MTSLRAISLPLPGPVLLQTEPVRVPNGRFSHFYAERDFEALGLPGRHVQEHASRYAAVHTVRGLHFQTLPRPQAKVVRVSQGRILDVVVDIRRGSPTWGQHASVEISAGDWLQLHVPPGFAHGFCTLEPDTEVVFRLTDYNEPALLRGLRWNDPALGIGWPCGPNPGYVFTVDEAWPALADLDSPFDWVTPPG